MDLEQIKKDLEEFKYLRKKSNGGRYAIWTTGVYASPIDNHLEELITAVEIERNRNEMLDKINLEQNLKLQKAEGVMRLYADPSFCDDGYLAQEYLKGECGDGRGCL